MGQALKLTQVLPRESELNKLLANCDMMHQIHLHELNDGALSMICFNCPFHRVLDAKEEEIVRGQMETQGIK